MHSSLDARHSCTAFHVEFSLWPCRSPSRRSSGAGSPSPGPRAVRALRHWPAARLACAGAAGMAPRSAGGRGYALARAPSERAARSVRADPSTSGRMARGHGTGWVLAAGGKGRLNFLYYRVAPQEGPGGTASRRVTGKAGGGYSGPAPLGDYLHANISDGFTYASFLDASRRISWRMCIRISEFISRT